MVLLGNLTSRTGRRIEWDAKNMKVLNDRDAQKVREARVSRGGGRSNARR
jgi:hypothetical protein